MQLFVLLISLIVIWKALPLQNNNVNAKTLRKEICDLKNPLKLNLTGSEDVKPTTEMICGTKTRRTLQYFNKTPAILKYSNFSEFKWHSQPIKEIENIIRMARVALKLQTLVLFADPKTAGENFHYFAALKQEKVIITSPQQWQVREFFSSNILSIVFVDLLPLNQPLLEIFKHSLHRWHLRKVLFVTQTSLLQMSELWQELFDWLHDHGFWNSFLIDLHENTLFMDHFSLKLLLNAISVEDFFHLSIEWPDLQGQTVHVTMANDPPRALILRDKSNQIIFSGYYGSIINIFADYYNASLVTHALSYLDYYHELDCLQYIVENKADVCCDAMALNTYSIYVITNPEELAASYLVVPQDRPLPRFYYFLKPFKLSLWWLILLTFLYTVVALSVIHRLQMGSWMLSYQLQYGVLSLIHFPLDLKRVRGVLRSYLELLLIFKSFVLSNWYLTLLPSLLYTRLYSQDINTLEDLQRLNISIIVNEYEYSMLNATDMDPIIAQQLQVVADDLLLKHRRNLDPQYAYYSQYDKNEFYLYQQRFLLHPRMKEMRDITIHYVMGGMPMRFNWPFEHLLNNIFGCLLDTGLYEYLLRKSREDGIRSGYLHFFPNEYRHVEPLSLEYFYLSGCILAAGYLLALASFLMEIFCTRIA